MTTLGQAYVQIMPSAKGISGSIGKILDPEAKSAGESAGNAIGNNLVGTITKVIAAAGIGKLIKDGLSASLSAGADIQQSFGGLDTLYSGAQKEIKQYASDAYKAGISANTYAENATAFGATLKQALGGDAVKAAKAADMAIMAMADNSAKMGTDIASVQQTYQSLARGNYAMLDNLKLGYGGTKSEMQRLLSDAEKLPKALGKKFDLSNFADVVEAINLVQENLGIAGVAAEEAKTTFSGSLQAMKASFTNVLAALSADELDIGPQLRGLAETTSTFLFGNFVPMIGRVFSQLPNAIGTFFATAGPIIEANLRNILPKGIIDLGLFDNLKATLASIGDMFKSVFKIDSGVVNTGVVTVANLLNGLMFVIQDMANDVSQFFQGFSNSGALSELSLAFFDLSQAGLDLSEKLSGAIPWEKIGSAVGQVVKFLAQVISQIALFSQKIDGNIFRGLLLGIPAVIAGFKAFNFLKSFNPLSFFKKSSKSAVDDVTKTVTGGKTKISAVLKSLGTMFKNAGQGIAIAAKGIGTGLATAFRGIGVALRLLNPAQILAFGGAIAIAAVGIGAGIAIIAAGFSLLATQGQGIATIIQAVGVAFGTVGSMLIGAFAQAIVTVSGVLPIVTSSLALLAPLVEAFGTALGNAAPFVTALGTAISSILTAAAPIVQTFADAFVQVATVVTNAVVQIVQALAPVMPAVTQMVTAIAPVLSQLVSAFNNLISQVGPIIDSLTQLFQTLGEQISSILESAGSVVESFGSAIRNVLDGVAGIFESMGNAAKNAGQGVKLMAQGVKMLVDLKLGDLVGTLTAVATGLGAIAASGIGSAGPGLQAAGTGLMLIAKSAQMASLAMQLLPSALSTLTSSIGLLPVQLTVASSAMTSFASSVKASVVGLVAVGSSVSKFATVVIAIAPALAMASAGLSAFNSQANSAGSAMQRLGASSRQALAQVTALGAGIRSSMTGATAAIANSGSQMAVAVRAAGTQMTVTMQASMNQIKMVVLNGMIALSQATRNGGTQMTTAIRQAGTQMVTMSQSTMNQMKSVYQNGMSSIVQIVRTNSSQMVSAWQSSGQQLVSATQNFVNEANNKLKTIGTGVNLHSNGSALMAGLKSGIDAGWSNITASVSSMAQWIKDHKGPISYDKRLLVDNGKAIMLGLERGISTGWDRVKGNVSGMTDELSYLFKSNVDDVFGMSNITSDLSHKLNVSALSKQSSPNNSTSKNQRALLDKIELLIEEVRRSGNTYLDGKIISRSVDRNLGQNTQLSRRTSWA